MNIHPVHPASRIGLPHSKAKISNWVQKKSPSKRSSCPSSPGLALSKKRWTNPILQTIGQPIQKGLAFSKLPPEISRMVWTFAHPPARVITIFESRDGVEDEEIVYSTAKVLTLLQVCRNHVKSQRNGTNLHSVLPLVLARLLPYPLILPRMLLTSHFVGAWSKIISIAHGSPYSISHRARCKVTRVIQEVSQFAEQSLSTSGYCPDATEALLVLYEEGMSHGDAKQSEFQPVTFQFNWQRGRTLYETYLDVPRRGEKDYTHRPWSLTEIQTVRFSGVVRDR